ncbi:MAG: hypothetical protein GX442_10500 [Candidatus Riflebacteria bacterium]|nr:hypothetical protein [Candidatus Riflebacteria bacterium]
MAHLSVGQESDLAERLRRGDVRAFSAVAAAYVEAVFRQAFLLLGSASDAEDATQEVLLKLFQEGRRLRGNRP